MAEGPNHAQNSPELARLDAKVASGEGLAVYFTAPDCGVCKVVRPGLMEMMRGEFPRLRWLEVDAASRRDIAGQYRVFSVPTLLVFMDGREVLRRARHLGVGAIRRELERPYDAFFGE